MHTDVGERFRFYAGTLPTVRGNVAVPGIRSPAVGTSRAMGTRRYIFGARRHSHCNEPGTARPHRWGNEARAYPWVRLDFRALTSCVSTVPQAFFADLALFAFVLCQCSHFVARRFPQFSPQRIYVSDVASRACSNPMGKIVPLPGDFTQKLLVVLFKNRECLLKEVKRLFRLDRFVTIIF